MAQITNNEKLKQQALREIAEGREEISAEVQRVRQHLSPARVLQRVVDRHAGLLVVLAVTAGVIPALLIFRGKRSPPVMISVAKPPPKPVLGALLLGALGLLARSVTPALMKSILMPQVHDFMAKRQPGTSAGNPPV
jgi:hypothetical protein